MMIRRMTVADYEEVYQLWRKTPGMGLNDVDDSKDGIQKYLLRNPNTCFVAIDGNETIGVILSGHDGRRGYLYHLAVAAHKRGHGIGRALLQTALDALGKENINKVALVVFERNETGNAFWEKCGFAERTDLLYRNKTLKEMTRIDT